MNKNMHSVQTICKTNYHGITSIIFTDKLNEQLPNWLRGSYSERAGQVTEIGELVHRVQNELYSGLSEPCITSLMIETLPKVYPNVQVENDLKLKCRY